MTKTRLEGTCKSFGACILAIPVLARRLTLLRTGVGFGLSTSISTLAKNSSAEPRTSKKTHYVSSDMTYLIVNVLNEHKMISQMY